MSTCVTEKYPKSELTEADFAQADVRDVLCRPRPWRQRFKSAGRWGALRIAAGLRTVFGSRAEGGFGILMYHRIAEPTPGVAPPTWNVPPEQFRRQLAGLLHHGFTPRRLCDVLALQQAGKPIPPRTFVVTFDDGYANNWLNAFPILQELGVPATIFLATDYLDSLQPFPFDDWSAAGSQRVPMDSWRPLTTAECKQLAESELIELGAHTHTHADFRNRPDDLVGDLRVCKTVLAERFGIGEPPFAFPYGTRKLGFSGPVLADVVKRAGLTCSLTTESELARPEISPFDWGRFTAEECDTAATLAAKLDGWYGWMRNVWRRIRRPFADARIEKTGAT